MGLKNFGSCLRDTELAISLKPDNIKAHYRRCKAYFKLRYYKKAEQALAEALAVDSAHKDLLELKQRNDLELQRIQTRIAALQKERKAILFRWKESWDVAQQLSVQLGFTSVRYPEPIQLQGMAPRLIRDGHFLEANEESIVSFPMLVMYPQYNQFDIVEHTVLTDMLVV